MVVSGVEKEEKGLNRDHRKLIMPTLGPERSKPPLHNFPMDCLKWGNQKFLRCVKVDSDSDAAFDRRSSPDRRRRLDDFEKRGSLDFPGSFANSPLSGIGGSKRSRVESEGEDGIEAVRMKLMLDFQTAVDKVKVSLMGEAEEEAEEESVAAAAAAAAVKPWNLRTRRAACKAPNGGGEGKSSGVKERRHDLSPLKTENKSSRLRGTSVAVASPEKKQRRNLTVTLSRREIEEDYYAILGERPPRRPKKRAKIVQKNLDVRFSKHPPPPPRSSFGFQET